MVGNISILGVWSSCPNFAVSDPLSFAYSTDSYASVLMQWAEGGSLDDFIDIRLGRRVAHPHIHPLPNEGIGRLDSDIDDSHEDATPTRGEPSLLPFSVCGLTLL